MAYPPPPYKDAVCGTPLSGEAICGVWWAYPAKAELDLNGRNPTLTTTTATTIAPPPAQLQLQADAVALVIQIPPLAPPKASLRFSTRLLVGFVIFSTLAPSKAVVRLTSKVPVFAGQEFLQPIVCVDLDLGVSTCEESALVSAGISEITLQTIDCR